jgi:hypothetical protein
MLDQSTWEFPQATVKLAFGQQDRTDNRCQARFGSAAGSPISRAAASGRFQANTACPPDNRPPVSPADNRCQAQFGFF